MQINQKLEVGSEKRYDNFAQRRGFAPLPMQQKTARRLARKK